MMTTIALFLCMWIALSYFYTFFISHNRFFAIHGLRWIMLAQYVGLFAYLASFNVIPSQVGKMVILVSAILIIVLKILPMLLNRYTEGMYYGRDILLFRTKQIIQLKQPSTELYVPADTRVDLVYKNDININIIIHIVLIIINFLIIYGAIVIDKV